MFHILVEKEKNLQNLCASGIYKKKNLSESTEEIINGNSKESVSIKMPYFVDYTRKKE
jgi:hypothetical protein